MKERRRSHEKEHGRKNSRISVLAACFLLVFSASCLSVSSKSSGVKAGKEAGSVSKGKSKYIFPCQTMIEVNYFTRKRMPDGDWKHIVWVIQHNNKSGTIAVEVDGKEARSLDFTFGGYDTIKFKNVEAMPGDATVANDLLTLKQPPPALTFKKEPPDKNPMLLMMTKGIDSYFVELKPNSGVWIAMRQITNDTLLDCPFHFDWDAPLLAGVNYADRENAQAKRIRHLWIEKREVPLADVQVDDQGFLKTKSFGRLEVKVPAAGPSILEAYYFEGTCRATRPQIKKIAEWIPTVGETKPDTGGLRIQGIELR